MTTIRVYFVNIKNISTWLPLVEYLLFKSAIYSIPNSMLRNNRYVYIKGNSLVLIK